MKPLSFVLCLALSGCVTVDDINTAFRRVDRQWQLDYQRTEDELRWRVIEADLPTAYKAVRLTFLDLGLPIKKESFDDRTIIAENEAPLPLTLDDGKRSRSRKPLSYGKSPRFFILAMTRANISLPSKQAFGPSKIAHWYC